ncbi:MAG: AAA family ATPase [Candidatus Omnitrophica bacterium]|nr:AAA family ATPase [Candidatus Omnitrophota bacterium]
MRIEKIVFKNYRQLRDLQILFEKTPNDLHVFVAQNGAAKTNILNGINWCLYDEEPHLSKESEALPKLNLNVIQESKIGSEQSICVQLYVRATDKRLFICSRTQRFKINENTEIGAAKKLPWLSSVDFAVTRMEPDGNSCIYHGEEAQQWVERFVPRNIREFYFFDGERLDTYFKDATAKNIYLTVNKISGSDDLRSIHRKLSIIKDEIARFLGRSNPAVERINEELNNTRGSIGSKIGEKEKCQVAINEADYEISQLDEKVKNSPDVQTLKNKLDDLEKRRVDKEALQLRKQKEKRNILFDYGKISFYWPLIVKMNELIREKETKKEMPPPIDEDILIKALRVGVCELCERDLDDKSRQHIDKLVYRFHTINEVAQQLKHVKDPLYDIEKKSMLYKKTVSDLTLIIKDYNTDLDKIESEITDIKNKLQGHDLEEVKTWYSKLKTYKEARDFNKEKLGGLKQEIDRLEKEAAKLERALEEEARKQSEVKEAETKLRFISAALGVIDEVVKNVAKSIKNKIEEATNVLFKNMMWKKNTYEKIYIDDDYNINVMHVDGYRSFGSMSGAEGEALALSFTLALHKISGFEGPLLIDTPVARVDDDNRKNMGNVLLSISSQKQVILLFTPVEYTGSIKTVLELKTNNKYKLVMDGSERETKMEAL